LCGDAVSRAAVTARPAAGSTYGPTREHPHSMPFCGGVADVAGAGARAVSK